MKVLQGKSVFHEVCIGRLVFYKRKELAIKRSKVEDTEKELERFHQVKAKAIEELKGLYDKTVETVGEANAAIFEIHQMMLEDLDYVESIENMITSQQVNLEYAIGTTADNFSAMFEAMDDAYMQGRAADIRDVSERMLGILAGADGDLNVLSEPVVIAADDLVPSETVQLDKNMVLGFAMQAGSVSSHTAILARSMGIPAVVGLGSELSQEDDGKEVIIDGFTGIVYLEPDEAIRKEMLQKKEDSDRRKEMLQSLKGKENVTLDGTKIKIYANIGKTADLGSVLANDAGGIGLFRSEFLYLENEDYPTEEQQFAAYKRAAETMAGKQVIIRTLDIGADKQADYFKLEKEENPALGYRAIRICLTRPEVFKTQLRALYRAAMFGNIAIMYPMIISEEEILRIKEIEKEVKAELKADGVPFKEDVSTGIMIETPAAALISDKLAEQVDFFSVGTNDLTQYTLAIDRQNQKLDQFCDLHHPALLKLIQMAADNAHAAGKWIGICGELGADTELTETFLRMGIDELSVSPSMVLSVRQKVRELDLGRE